MDFLNLARDIDIFEKNLETHEEITFLSRIEAIDQQSIFISPPFKKDCYWQSLRGEVGTVFSARVGTERCSYFFDTQLIDINSTPAELWEMSLPTNVTKMQRRQYVRLAILLDVTIKFIDPYTKDITTVTKDISAGGVQIILEEPPTDLDVKIILPLSKDVTIEAKGAIIRVAFPTTSRRCFTIAIKFNEMPNEKQEQITKYIFHKEVERRQKEKHLFGKSLRSDQRNL